MAHRGHAPGRRLSPVPVCTAAALHGKREAYKYVTGSAAKCLQLLRSALDPSTENRIPRPPKERICLQVVCASRKQYESAGEQAEIASCGWSSAASDDPRFSSVRLPLRWLVTPGGACPLPALPACTPHPHPTASWRTASTFLRLAECQWYKLCYFGSQPVPPSGKEAEGSRGLAVG